MATNYNEKLLKEDKKYKTLYILSIVLIFVFLGLAILGSIKQIAGLYITFFILFFVFIFIANSLRKICKENSPYIACPYCGEDSLGSIYYDEEAYKIFETKLNQYVKAGNREMINEHLKSRKFECHECGREFTKEEADIAYENKLRNNRK